MSRLLAEHHAGWIAPPGDAPALARALAEALDDPAARQDGARTLLAQFRWDRVLEPLVAFCRDPRIDDTKERFGQRPATIAPADRLAFRLRRRLGQWRRRV
jgi:thioredoxin-like negative regulator of GroEL